MKMILSVIVSTVISVMATAQPPMVPAVSGSSFGKKITATNAVSVEEMQTKLFSNGGSKSKEVKIKGVVTDVCTMEGCWIKVQSPDGKIMVKMNDHQFTVPLALTGKTVIIGGSAEEKITSVEQLKHYAADAGKSKAEIDAIKEPKKEIIVNATGLLVI